MIVCTLALCLMKDVFADEILKVNDNVMKVMSLYKKVVEGISEENGLLLGECMIAGYPFSTGVCKYLT